MTTLSLVLLYAAIGAACGAVWWQFPEWTKRLIAYPGDSEQNLQLMHMALVVMAVVLWPLSVLAFAVAAVRARRYRRDE